MGADIVRRIYVEKRKEYDVYSRELFADLRDNLGILGLTGVRVLNRYDVMGLPDEYYQAVRDTIFAELPIDIVYDEEAPVSDVERVFAVEYLPGQYDQRADGASQCAQLLTHGARLVVSSARFIVICGKIGDDDFERVKSYCINPVDSREASLNKPNNMDMKHETPSDVAVMRGFINLKRSEIDKLRRELSLAMKIEDILFCQQYFRDTEKRDPTISEIRVLDTYWSDHCRHTTFLTAIKKVEIEDAPLNTPVKIAFETYKRARAKIGGKKEMSLMDIALMGMRELRQNGMLDDLDVSDEINACGIVVPAVINDAVEDWLVLFKNETHNHPTEIEPFGGAATCLGGAIRDPLSGRSYVYQAMRVTGAGDPRVPVKETMAGKLPQRKITALAARGYSSYGNQIGLATGMVSEIYHNGYVAKRMEIGAVVGAVPLAHVVRREPQVGDVVALLGGRTGRDGCGGATGSSKEHTEESIQTCGAEVQKGNPPTERKIQRLFRDSEVSRLIRRCNDFGAGGVAVAIGELASGLDIDLDAVPKKYEGLDGTELAISESQERMAVVIDGADLKFFETRAESENLETAVVAKVTDTRRLRMFWRGKAIVDISRDFIDTSGALQETDVFVKAPSAQKSMTDSLSITSKWKTGDISGAYLETMSNLNVCGQRGMAEMFDSSIGAATVLMPFGGKYQKTPIEAMVAKLPVVNGETVTGTAMSYGFDPYLSTLSPFHGAVYAVIHSVAKIVAVGGDHRKIRLTLQEYFEKLGADKTRWGKPFAALLGAYFTQIKLNIAAIGGKDSMSGTFKDIHVPPTLVSFALAPIDVSKVVSPEFKRGGGATVVLVSIPRDDFDMPKFEAIDGCYGAVHDGIVNGHILSVHTIGRGGAVEAVAKMCFGNGIGFRFDGKFDVNNVDVMAEIFKPYYGNLVIELTDDKASILKHTDNCAVLGVTIDEKKIVCGGQDMNLEDLYRAWDGVLEKVFPTNIGADIDTRAINVYNMSIDVQSFPKSSQKKAKTKTVKPRVLIPIFPGTNCEYDTARRFTKAGAKCDFFVLKNIKPSDIDESVYVMSQKITEAQILAIPGGFSAGDEPDGSGKFIAAFFRNPCVKDAVTEFLNKRDGLMLGICNGFQALIKLGLVPYGEIRDFDANSPTLTFNTIGRHISRIAYVKIKSVNSPWLTNVNIDDVYAVPISHGEGRFVASPKQIDALFTSQQVAAQYVNCDGLYEESMYGNCNGSYGAIEGILSPNGKILGKMGHIERIGDDWVARNIQGDKNPNIFEAGVTYFL